MEGSGTGDNKIESTEPGAEASIDPVVMAELLTEFYANLFKATDRQRELPKWVYLRKPSPTPCLRDSHGSTGRY